MHAGSWLHTDKSARHEQNMQKLRDNNRCYVCGMENSAGLHVAFEVVAGQRSIRARFIPAPDHQGFEGMVHGGILSAVLDETMAKLAYVLGIPAVTAQLEITFKAPAAPGDELSISGSIVSESKRLVLAEARIERGPMLIAEAKGKLVRL